MTGEKYAQREKFAIRAEREIESGYYVNLGIGMPTLVANFISENKQWCSNLKTVF